MVKFEIVTVKQKYFGCLGFPSDPLNETTYQYDFLLSSYRFVKS